MSAFVSSVRSTMHHCASKGIDAPINDLTFWNDLHSYRKVDQDIAEAALLTLENHLWYLSEELTPLSLFSDKVDATQKTRIAKRIMKHKGNPEYIFTLLYGHITN